MATIPMHLALLGLVLLAAACGQSPAPDNDATSATVDNAADNTAKPAENVGSVDVSISGRTVGADNKQCEMSFELVNNSAEEVRNFYVEFEVSNAATGEVTRPDQPLVIPGTIKPRERKAAFGPVYVDRLDCANVKLKPLNLVAGSCREDCVPYRYSATGIAGI